MLCIAWNCFTKANWYTCSQRQQIRAFKSSTSRHGKTPTKRKTADVPVERQDHPNNPTPGLAGSRGFCFQDSAHDSDPTSSWGGAQALWLPGAGGRWARRPRGRGYSFNALGEASVRERSHDWNSYAQSNHLETNASTYGGYGLVSTKLLHGSTHVLGQRTWMWLLYEKLQGMDFHKFCHVCLLYNSNFI